MQVEAIAGDNHLGGEDFTHVIIQDCLAKNDLANDVIPAEVHAVLYQKAERLKQELTSQQRAQFEFSYKEETLVYSIFKSEYEELCEGLLARMRMPIGRVLNDGQVTVEELDRVILIGGATKDYVVRSFLGKLLRTFPYTHINPDEAVGIGAGIQSALKKDHSMVSEMMLTDVCGHTLGVEISHKTESTLVQGVFSPIIERNTTIPVSRVQTYYSMEDNQPHVRFGIYQGESPLVKDNLKIGELSIPIKKAPSGYPIDCRFTYDTNGLLEIIVTEKQTGKSRKLVIEESPGKLTPKEIEASLKKLENLKIHPRDRAENRLLLARIERLYAESIGEMRMYVQSLLMHFEAVMNKQDEQLTKKTVKELTEKLTQLEKGYWL